MLSFCRHEAEDQSSLVPTAVVSEFITVIQVSPVFIDTREWLGEHLRHKAFGSWLFHKSVSQAEFLL